MLDLLRILLRWRRPLVVFSLVAAAVAAAITFALTPRYYSQASILPPADTPGFGNLSALLQQYQIPIPGGSATPFLPTLYAAIVRSRKMGTRILDDFELRAVLPGRNDEEDFIIFDLDTQQLTVVAPELDGSKALFFGWVPDPSVYDEVVARLGP